MERERNIRVFRDDLTAYQQVREVLADYPLNPISIRNQGKTWVAQTEQGNFRVERFNHSIPEFFFVLASIEYLESKGCSAFPEIWLNINERPLTEKQYGLFFVTEYPDGQAVDVQEIDVLTRMVRNLADLHRLSVGFTPPELLQNIRQDWGDWEEKWQYRLDELYRLGEEAQHRRGDFDKEYLKGLDDALRDGVDALETLKRLGFRQIVEVERARGGLCHRDYRPINLLEKDDGYWLLDFDDFAGQSHLEDIARLIKEVGGWDADRINYILNEYQKIYAIAPEEKEAIFAYLKLPSDLWRIARNYYVKGKPQKRNLKGVLNEMKDKKRCFHQLAHPRDIRMNVEELPWMWSIPPEPTPIGAVDDYWNAWNKQMFHTPATLYGPDASQQPIEPMLHPETENTIANWLNNLESNYSAVSQQDEVGIVHPVGDSMFSMEDPEPEKHILSMDVHVLEEPTPSIVSDEEQADEVGDKTDESSIQIQMESDDDITDIDRLPEFTVAEESRAIMGKIESTVIKWKPFPKK